MLVGEIGLDANGQAKPPTFQASASDEGELAEMADRLGRRGVIFGSTPDDDCVMIVDLEERMIRPTYPWPWGPHLFEGEWPEAVESDWFTDGEPELFLAADEGTAARTPSRSPEENCRRRFELAHDAALEFWNLYERYGMHNELEDYREELAGRGS